MKPISVVIPALGDVALLKRGLPGLFAEFDARSAGDELLLVDDTGNGSLEAHRDELFGERSDAVLIQRKRNGGFADAVEAGVEKAKHSLVFSMNSDVVVQAGFIEPLVDALVGADAFAAAPKVLLNGNQNEIESFTGVHLKNGLLSFRSADPGPTPDHTVELPFAVGGTFLFDRARFLELGGFDSLFAPFYFEDNDLCWRAWRRSWATLYVPAAVVEHHHKGTIGSYLNQARRRAAVERGELLFNWKHLDQEDLGDHMALLFRRALDGYLTDNREELTWLSLALEQVALIKLGRSALEGELSSHDVLARFTSDY